MSVASPALKSALVRSWRVVAVDGRDARSFLQGQLTQDLATLAPDKVAGAALLSAQGRVIAAPWLRVAGETIELVVPADLGDAVLTRLQRYVLRARVQLSVRDLDDAAALAVVGHLGAETTLADPQLAMIRAGQPLIGAANTEEWIPQMLNLDLLGAVSFTKGCYTGQEIVARTQHLGRIKRRMFRLSAAGAPPPPKSALVADAQKVGDVVMSAATAAGCELLAVINLEARQSPLALERGDGATPLPLPYAIP